MTMKLKTNKSDLLPALQKAIKFVPRRSVMPVLDCFKLSASDDGLLISATNLEMAISIPAESQVEESGETLVSAKLFLSIIASMSNEIEISCKDYKLKISDENGTSNLSTLDAEEFPSIELSADKLFAIEAQDFARITRQAGQAASSEESRPVLTGLHYISSGDLITVTGTDGFTMVEANCGISGSNGNVDVLVPAQHAVTIASIFDNATVGVFGNDATIGFSANGITVSTQLIEGMYPKVEQIKPNESNMQSVRLDKDEILSAISRASVFGNEINLAKFSVSPNDITLLVENSEIGKSEVSVNCESDTDVDIALNYVYLKKLIEQVNNDVIIKLTDSRSPVVVKDNDTDTFYSVIMPMHLER